jgi:hypothetical protein
MWSGPRNISTAMMRAWGSRPDTAVCDEPLYAHFLKATGKDHPGAAEVLATHETDWRAVVVALTAGAIPDGKAIFYQKHMAHHMLPGMDREWVLSLRNVLLIRDPDAMLASLARIYPNPGLDDTGLPQQVELLEFIERRTGRPPAVVAAEEVLRDPPGALRRLCARMGVPYLEAMLRWEPGPRDTDGVWGPYWYASVYASTGFQPYSAGQAPPQRLMGLRDACRRLHERLCAHVL